MKEQIVGPIRRIGLINHQSERERGGQMGERTSENSVNDCLFDAHCARNAFLRRHFGLMHDE